ncbi:MAG: biotin--[acetyl-CoA-carboxylase] ligase [Flavobacteriaceae bacterium]
MTAAQGYRTERFASIDSTNAEALRRAAAGDPGRLWIVAGLQTSGRGRRGRQWSSPPGNLHSSLLLRPAVPASRLHELGFVAGVALTEAVRAAADAGAAEAVLKWPNDLLVDGAKVAGILIETEADRLSPQPVAVGIGVNCMHAPPDTPYRATTLEALGGAADPVRLFAELHRAMRHWLGVWEEGGFAPVRARWSALSMPEGAGISVSLGETRVEGRYGGIDDNGALRLVTDAGTRTIQAGDVYPASAVEPV